MKLIKRLTAIILVLITLVSLFSFSAFAAQTGTYKITAEPSLRIRSGPGTGYSKLGNVYCGQTVTVTEVSGNWGKITYNGVTGWISLEYASYVTPSNNNGGNTTSQTPGKQFTVSEAGLAMIKEFEGYYRYKYWDGGHYSIGYGSTCGANDYPNGISEQEASDLLKRNMPSYEAGLDKFLSDNGIKVTQKQYDALVSFTFNFGNPWTRWDEFDLKTMLIKGVQNYTPEQIKAAFGEFVKSGGSVLPGLVTRRNKEAEYFISGTSFYQTGSFKDVYTRDWYYDAVEFVNDNGIMTGIGGGKFDPDTVLTRAMMVTTLAKLGTVKMDAYKGKTSFNDVKATDWFAPYVEWAYKQGITNGIGDGKFAPNAPITRQDLIVMLYKFVEKVGYKVDFVDNGILDKFVDGDDVSEYATTAMTWALIRKCISGNNLNELMPKDTATRAATAQIMSNYYKNGRVY